MEQGNRSEQELLAEWLLECEAEIRAAQQAVTRRRPHAQARYRSARAEYELASAAVERFLAFQRHSRHLPRAVSACPS